MSIKITPLDGEEMLVSVRKSPLKYTKQILILILMYLLASALLYFGSNGYVYLLAMIVYFLTTVGVIIYLYIWFSDIYLITNKRVIAVDKKGLLSHTVSEMDVRDIHAVSYTQKGLLQSLFTFGSVLVVGRNDIKMSLDYVFNPSDIHEILRTIYVSISHNN